MSSQTPPGSSAEMSSSQWQHHIDAIEDVALLMLDVEGRILASSRAAERMYGYAKAELVGRHFSTTAAGDPELGPAAELEAVLALSSRRAEHEGWLSRRDGSRFWARVSVTSVRGDSGELLGFTVSTRELPDVAPRDDLIPQPPAPGGSAGHGGRGDRDLHHRLELILEGLADGVAATTREGKLVFANEAAALAMGFPSVEACMAASLEERANRFELLDESGAPIDVHQLPGPRVLRGEPPCAMVVHVRDRDSGQEWWREIKATPIAGADGRPELAIYIWHDVTESRRREQHDTYVASATAALSESLDYASTLSTLAHLLVPGLGDWCSIHLIEHGKLESVAVSHVDPDKVRFAREVGRRYPPDPKQPTGVWNVLRTGRSELYADIPDALLERGAQDAEHLRILREAGMRSVLIVPIRMRERVIGTLSLVSAESGRRYDAHHLRLAEELGLRAGSSIENARLYTACICSSAEKRRSC